jgi:hypothetical protein
MEVYVKSAGFARFCNGDPLMSWTVIRGLALRLTELLCLCARGRRTWVVESFTTDCVNIFLLVSEIYVISFRGGSVGSVTLVTGACHGIGLTQRCFACVVPCGVGVMSRLVSTLYSISHDARDGSRFESTPSFLPFRTKGAELIATRPKNSLMGKHVACCDFWDIHVVVAQKLLSVLWFHSSISFSRFLAPQGLDQEYILHKPPAAQVLFFFLFLTFAGVALWNPVNP